MPTPLGTLGQVRGWQGLVREVKALERRLNSVTTQTVPLAALIRALFHTPGGTAQLVTPEQYGAVGTGVADDSAALLEVAALGVPVFCNPDKVYAVSQPITAAAGTFFTDGRLGRALTGVSGARIQAMNSFSGGDAVVEFPAGTVGGGVGINVRGLGGIASALAGVHIADGCYNITVRDAWIGAVSDSPIKFSGQPVACYVDNNILGYDVTGRTLSGPTGVLHVTGTDHYIGNENELNGGPAWVGGPSNGYDRVSYPGQYWRCGLYLSGQFVVVGMSVPEFCDTGLYVEAGALENRFYGARSDFSAGPGVYVLGSDNDFIGFQVNGAGFATPYDGLLYDGVVHAGSAARNRWSRFGYNIAGAPVGIRYGWSDTVTGNGSKDENRLESHTIRPEFCFYDTVYRAEPRTAVVLGGSGPLRDRPPSRWANGQHWTDTERGIDCYSDGSAWRDAFGGVSGNLATPKLAEGIGGTMQIQNADTTCTVGGGYWPALTGTTAVHMPFGPIAGATCTAAGATVGHMNVATVADGGGAFTAVVAGEDYTYTITSVAATIAATLTVVVNYFDAGNVYLSSSALLAATGGGTNSTTAATDTYWRHVTAPVGAFFAQPVFRFTRTGMAAGEAHFLNGVTIMPDSGGVVTGYVRP